MFIAVDAVLVFRVSPAHDNTKCRHSTLDISISTVNPYCYSFFINSPFLWKNIPTNILLTTNCPCYALVVSFLTCITKLSVFVLVCVVSYTCCRFVLCMCCCFGEQVHRPSLLCNPCPLKKLIIMNHSTCVVCLTVCSTQFQ